MIFERELPLKCGVCGNTNFEFDESTYNSIEDADQIKCSNCKKIYTPEELKEANSTLIDHTLEEMAKEAIDKAFKQFK